MRKALPGLPSPGLREDEEPSVSGGELRALVSMIGISAETLTCLRTECATSAGLIQQEIRTLEGKLIKLFSRAMVLIRQPGSDPEEPNRAALVLWLSVVGLSDSICQALTFRIRSLEDLMSRSDSDVRLCLKELGASAEDTRRLVAANKNLRRYTDILTHGGSERPEEEMPLHWDSWDRSSPSSASSSSSSSLVSAGTDKSRHRSHHQVPTNRTNRTSPTPGRYTDDSSSSGATIAASGSTTSGIGNSDYGHSPQSPPVFSPPSSQVPSLSVSLSPTPSPTYHPGSSWQSSLGPSPPASPPVHKNRHVDRGKAAQTPPSKARKPHHHGSKVENQPRPPPQCIVTNSSTDNGMFPLTKSKSHESQLGNRIDVSPKSGQKGNVNSNPGDANGRHRLPTDGGLDAIDSSNHPLKSPPECDSDSSGGGGLQVPRSPVTPTFPQGSMSHVIEHRFTKSFSFRVATCDYCQKQMIMGMRCKECKYKCHNDCSVKVPPSCGLPHDIFQEVMKNVTGSPVLGRAGMSPVHGSSNLLSSPSQIGNCSSHLRRKKNSGSGFHPNISVNAFQGPDSSSTASSCNSSTPSSPNVVLTVSTPPSASRHKQFFFPEASVMSRKPNAQDVSNSAAAARMEEISRSHIAASSNSSLPSGGSSSISVMGSSRVSSVTTTTTTTTTSKTTLPEGVDSQKSNDSDKTLSVSGNGSGGSVEGSTTDSERTIAARLDSQDSQASEAGPDDKPWPRQNSLSLREWDIPFDELQMIDRIGVGRFGSVYKGQWHGYVAIKVLNMDNVDDRDQTLEAFKNEVGTFRKTRHENLVLFMGACMKPPHLAIVTSLCKGSTLYTHIHIMKDRFSMSKVVIIAQQISQGMGYLHARGIVHKDLKTRNIFLEGGKVVITDFGLFSVAKLCCPAKSRSDSCRDDRCRFADALAIPKGWLCYLSPEIVRSLRVGSLSTSACSYPHKGKDPFALPFSQASDMYSFGTVWYELLCGEFPFERQTAESVIWQVGKGIKDPLINIQASREVKDVLMNCWAYNPDERPEFGALLEILKEWPKKKPKRSPSYPTHLSRSHESVF